MIGFVALAPFTSGDSNNDVGGNSSSTGNFIINYGGAAGATSAAVALRTAAQYEFNASYNTINNNNGGGTNHPNALRGIYITASTSATSTINNNTITINGGGTTHIITGIENAAGSSALNNTVSIRNNIISNSTYTTATTGGFYGIYNTASPAILLIKITRLKAIPLRQQLP